MNTKFLSTFVAVVDCGSMAAAARQLNITPAAVAQQTRTLERQIGAPLIRRSGHTVVVTEAGAGILERARNLLRDVADLHTVAIDDAIGGELRIGAGGTALTGIVPDILSRVIKKFPQITVSIRTGLSIDLHRAVENGELDAAFVLEAPFALNKTVSWKLVREEPLVVLAPQNMAGCDPHELLATQHLIRYDRNWWGGHQVDEYLREADIVPIERFELNSLHAIAVMVDRGLGVALVPDWARPWPEKLDVVRIPLPLQCKPRRVGVVWCRSSIRIRLLKAFLQEI
ncbi:MAG: LysR family transcriptional regulator [Alphaproteobacteria bacterium]|nr:MAG: LysR family transcriptional regulator [Alphaproteobacteria bacterium]